VAFSKIIGNVRAAAIVAALIFFYLPLLKAQSDTSFVRLSQESGYSNFADYEKKALVNRFNTAFSLLLKDKKWNKLYACGLGYFMMVEQNIITNDEAVQQIKDQLSKLPKNQYLQQGKYNHLLFLLVNRSGHVHQSLNYGEQAARFYRIEGDSTSKSKLFNILCFTHIQIRDYLKAVAFGKQAVIYAQTLDVRRKSIALENLGLAYLYSGNGFLGRNFLEKSKEIYYTNDLTNYFKRISECYQAEGDNVCAMMYADSSINFALKNKSENVIFALTRKGEILQANKDYKLAMVFFNKAL
jgi:hypothetical protein